MPWVFPWVLPNCQSWSGDPLPALVGSVQKKELASRMEGWRTILFNPLIRVDNSIVRKGHWQDYLDDDVQWKSKTNVKIESGHVSSIEPR